MNESVLGFMCEVPTLVAGAAISIVTAGVYGCLRKPKILITHNKGAFRPEAGKGLHAGVTISNPRRWFAARETASSCRVELKFRDKDECPVSCPDDFPQEFIEGRWDAAEHPNGTFETYDDAIHWDSNHIDRDISVVSGPKETQQRRKGHPARQAHSVAEDSPRSRQVQLAIYTPAGDYFVWSAEMVAYLGKQTDSLPERDRLKLTLSEYVVTVKVTTGSGKEYRAKFILYTPKGGEGFRLAPYE